MKDQPVNRGGIYARYFLKQAERPAVTKPLHESVTKIEASRKRGRPIKRDALTPADRARAYRERKKADANR